MILTRVLKTVALLFWLIVLWNFVQPLPAPFSWLLPVSGAVILIAHAVELVVFAGRRPAEVSWTAFAVQVLLFGVIHIRSLPVAPKLS